MSFVTQVKVGKHTYLYEATAYRNENGEPRNKKHPIGKIDPRTGEAVYKPEYIDRMAEAGTPVASVAQPMQAPMFTIADIQGSHIREFGAYYLFQRISESVGLSDILEASVPDCWAEVLTLAIYLVCTEDPFMYCSLWMESTETLPVGDLSSQRISRLLKGITESCRSRFYGAWCRYRREREYLALDITSISSWSELIEDVEWGHNRDHDDLPQVNLCLLMGEKSRLPVYQTMYSGSLKDVSTLSATIDQVSQYLGDSEILLVMDKGFFSKANVDAMLASEKPLRFIIPVPFTAKFAKNQVHSEKKDIDRVENTIVSGKDSVRGVTKVRAWGNGSSLYTHIYFNARKAAQRKEELYAHVSELVRIAREDPANKNLQREFQKYLIVRASSKNEAGHTVNVRENVIERELETSGWLVLVSNHIANPREALHTYRAKDVVEKGFFRLKNSMDLNRLRVHSQESALSKSFVGFLSLILLSHIHNVMLERELYKRFSIKELILTLSKLRVQYINGQRILFPVTKTQRLLFEAFNVELPA